MMNNPYTFIPDLPAHLEVPANGILSRAIHQDENLKVVLFGFDAGQELSEHTASLPAVIQIIQGEATLTLGSDTIQAKTGAWAHLPPLLEHSVHAKTPVIMLLTLIKKTL